MPKVSVIIPVYGVEKYIERCARSLFEQTLDDIEYLFINDCTPDRSIEILENVLDEYPNRKDNVIIHRMEQNSGQAAVRKWGMQNATGEYVIHCDSDDWVDTDMYRAMYEKAVEEGSDVVICDYVVTDGINRHEKVNAFINTTWIGIMKDMLYMHVSWALWNKLFKRICLSAIGQYPTGAMAEDMTLVMQMMSKANSLSFIRQPYYQYFVNTNSITKSVNEDNILKCFYQAKANTDIIIDYWKKKEQYNEIKGGLNYVAYNAKNRLLPILNKDKKYKDLWSSSYPQVERIILMDNNASVNERLHCLLVVTHLYHVLKNNTVMKKIVYYISILLYYGIFRFLPASYKPMGGGK